MHFASTGRVLVDRYGEPKRTKTMDTRGGESLPRRHLWHPRDFSDTSYSNSPDKYRSHKPDCVLRALHARRWGRLLRTWRRLLFAFRQASQTAHSSGQLSWLIMMWGVI